MSQDKTALLEHDIEAQPPNAAAIDDGDSTEDSSSHGKGIHYSLNDQEKGFGRFKKWNSIKGLSVLICGTGLPALLIFAYASACFERITRLIIKHPVETLIEAALIVSIPIINYLVWKAANRKDGRYAMRRGILNGMCIGTAAVIATICGAALCMDYPSRDPYSGESHATVFTFLMFSSFIACITSVYLANELRQMWDFKSSRIRCVVYSLLGALFAVGTFAACEARPVMVRIAEQMALSHDRAEHDKGLEMLRQLNAERDLIMEGADPRTAGLPGLFLHINPQYMRPLYFAVTGKPYRDQDEANWAVLSDDYLRRHLVGDVISGLSLLRSSVSSEIHPKTLSATTTWTFVFSNDQYQDQEVRAEIGLPPGAVITGLTTWKDGTAHRASFSAAGDATSSSIHHITADHYEPAIISDLGRGRALLHCYPVPGHAELKAQITMVTPLKSDGPHSASLGLPRIICSNFKIAGEHKLLLNAADTASLTVASSKERKGNYQGTRIMRTLDNDELSKSGLFVRVGLPSSFQPVTVRDPFTNKKHLITESIQQVTSPAPQRLVVVLDASIAVREHLEPIRNALKQLPSSVNASLLLARADGKSVAVPLSEGLAKLTAGDFSGGQDNLESVIQGAELAGQSKNGAVLWIHGPQPGYSKEIYIMAPFVSKPKLFELPVDNGETDVREFLKNHDELLPATSIPRTGSLQFDIDHFVDRWNSGEAETKVAFGTSVKDPNVKEVLSGAEATEVSVLWANQRVQELIAQNKVIPAACLAIEHGIVTQVSLAAVFDQQKTRYAWTWDPERDGEMPMIQGATNGTIGPQLGDATVVSGVNTAGTVRVNNLANLEAALNLFTNLCELIGMLFGAIFLFLGFNGSEKSTKLFGADLPLTKSSRKAIGVALIVGALMLPGLVNYFVASARDANLFS